MVRCPPPFGPTMKIFYRRLYMKRCVFCRFPANFRKIGEFAASIERSKAKSLSASLALCARHAPPLPNPKYATGSTQSRSRPIKIILKHHDS